MSIFGIPKAPKDTKVVVAMSGGVDSSVVAALLHSKGYQVIGVTLQLYDMSITAARKGSCCAGQDIYDAKNVADKLGIPHYVLDYESLFRQEVIEDFADSYLRGETPIPCIKCNQSVKFRDLMQVAKDLGADALATGHYVRKIEDNFSGNHSMLRALDYTKDQSYFLFATTKEQLRFTYFPLGAMHKDETRRLAAQFGLEIAAKPDSQDICFVPDGSYVKVISKIRPNALIPGDIVDLEGKVLGHHSGLINYTIGQRRGLGIAHPDPLYVVKLDPETNRVIVGTEDKLYKTSFVIRDLNLLVDKECTNWSGIEVKIRSSQAPIEASVKFYGEQALIELYSKQRAITKGQACVFYSSDLVLGGGWII